MTPAKLLSRRALALALTLATFGLSACLRIPPSGVAVKAVTADLVFGVPPLPEPVAPPSFGAIEEEPVALRPTPTNKVSKPIQRPATPTPSCPTATDTTFPEEEASTTVKGVPAEEGLYVWKYTKTTRNAQGATVTVSDFTGKGFAGIRQTSANNSEFSVGEFAERGGKTVIILQDFRVTQDGGDNDGIFLTRITTFENSSDRQGSSFVPSPAILMLPLPVRAGLTLGDDNAGIDGATLAVLRQTGTVTGRKRIDVCGTVLDSWFVDAQQQYVAPSGTGYDLDYNYGVVTHLGGYIGIEFIGSADPFFTIDQNIGALKPFAPIPEQFR